MRTVVRCIRKQKLLVYLREEIKAGLRSLRCLHWLRNHLSIHWKALKPRSNQHQSRLSAMQLWSKVRLLLGPRTVSIIIPSSPSSRRPSKLLEATKTRLFLHGYFLTCSTQSFFFCCSLSPDSDPTVRMFATSSSCLK